MLKQPHTAPPRHTQVTGLPDAEEDPVEDACLGFQHALVRTRGGRAFAWGKGERGQLGNGATASHPSAFPVDLPEGLPPVVKVGVVWCGMVWG